MRARDRWFETDEDRQSSSLAAALALLVLVIVSLVVVRKLQVRSMLEECMLSQRPGCAATVDRLRVSVLIDGAVQTARAALAR